VKKKMTMSMMSYNGELTRIMDLDVVNSGKFASHDSGEETGSTDMGDVQSPPSPQSRTDEDILTEVPKDAQGNYLSIGSLGHEEGTCKPCVFAYNEAKPCENGFRCSFCHYVHPPKKRVRLCKKKRMELRRLQDRDGDGVFLEDDD
jgi:hypothetical protein